MPQGLKPDQLTEQSIGDPLKELLKKVQITLVRTSHSGNIGSAARAMKTMGLTQLGLVEPDNFPAEEANWMASGATDILDQARVYQSVSEAVADKTIVIGTSSRSRRIPTPQLTPSECATLISQLPEHQSVAIIFGREASGLDNKALDLCHYHLSVPANPEYPVMNLAMTVQVVCYEIRQALLSVKAKDLMPSAQQPRLPLPEVDWDIALASHEDLERFFSHLNSTLIQLGFINPASPRQTMRRFRRLFQRIHMDEMEVNLLRGLLTAIDRTKQGQVQESE